MGLELLFIILGWVALGFIGYTVYTTVKLQMYPEDVPVEKAPVRAPASIGKASTGPTLPSTQDARFLFFFAPWCPWSKKAKVQWDAFITEVKRYPATYGGKRVSLETINGDQSPDMVNAYKITAYPTFKLVTSDGVTEMTGHPSPDGFKTLLIKTLGPEEPAKIA
jgi:thiol-disulfide isomerase/thioredoxin